jgi:hypothetical protein
MPTCNVSTVDSDIEKKITPVVGGVSKTIVRGVWMFELKLGVTYPVALHPVKSKGVPTFVSAL